MNLLLSKYIKRQKSRLFAYLVMQQLFIALILFFLGLHLSLLFSRFSVLFQNTFNFHEEILTFGICISLLVVCFYLFLSVRRVFSSDLKRASALAIEAQASFFTEHPELKSELVTAGDMLDGQAKQGSFESAHLSRWNNLVAQLRWELLPIKSFWLNLSFLFVLLVSFVSLQKANFYPLPTKIVAWQLKDYEEMLPYEDYEWRRKEGVLSSLMGATVRFEVFDRHSILKNFLFVQESQSFWRRIPCDQFCSFEMKESGRFAVGNLFYRSAAYPIVVLQDEEPKVVLFVVDGDELVPEAQVLIENKKSIQLEVLASDDVGLKKYEFRHRFEEEDTLIQSEELSAKRLKKRFELSLAEWKGGRHELYMKVRDNSHEVDSNPIVIGYADEEFLRQKRVQDLQEVLNEWTHVLADLLESEADNKIIVGFSERISEVQYPDSEEDSVISVFYQELSRLAEKMQVDLVMSRRLDLLPSYRAEVEKQILYGLSLIFQEQVGDVQASQDALRDSQADLSKLLEDFRNGKQKMSSEKLQKAFEDLSKRLKDLMDKVSKLPKGPQDNLINRDALDKQVSEAKSLEEQIAEIQKKLNDGNQEQALKELESLVNKLSILQKEMESSFSQAQENLEKGVLESSEKFEKKLKSLREEQENLAEKTEETKKKLEKQKQLGSFSDDMDQSLGKQEKLSEEKLNTELQELAEGQKEIEKKFQEATEEFDKMMKGSQFEKLLRSEQAKEAEQEIQGKMQGSESSLRESQPVPSLNGQREAIELMRQAEESQQKQRKQIQDLAQQQGAASGQHMKNEKMEIVDSQGKGERERRRKIMESRRQDVDDKYRPSHERYFEELLQR